MWYPSKTEQVGVEIGIYKSIFLTTRWDGLFKNGTRIAGYTDQTHVILWTRSLLARVLESLWESSEWWQNGIFYNLLHNYMICIINWITWLWHKTSICRKKDPEWKKWKKMTMEHMVMVIEQCEITPATQRKLGSCERSIQFICPSFLYFSLSLCFVLAIY